MAKYDHALSEKQRSEWDEETKDMIARIGEAAANAKTNQLEQELQAKLQQVEQQLARGERQSMMSKLDSMVPGWRATNERDDFIADLQNVEPLSGMTYHQLLRDAWARNDANRVANFFRDWQRDNARPRTPAPAADNLVRGVDGNWYRPGGRTGGNTVKQSEIQLHYRRSAEGYYQNDADRQAEEMRIHDAVRRGAVVKG